MTEETQQERDMRRLKVDKDFGDGTQIGTVADIRNVSSWIWTDFKKISRLYGNSEGAALAACVQSWKSDPANEQMLMRMKAPTIEQVVEKLEQKGVKIDRTEEKHMDSR